MRVFARVGTLAAAAACLGLALPGALTAQEAEGASAAPAAAASAPAEALPSRPIPYTQLVRPERTRAAAAAAVAARRRALAARPAPARPTAAAAPVQAMRPGARLNPVEPIPPAELEAFVDGAVRQAMVGGRVPGVAVSVVQNGQVVLEKGYGSGAPGRPVDPHQTLFRLGSVSKVFTWIAVLKAVEDGRMKLDDPVNAHLPPALQLKDQGYRQPVRVRDLLAHTSGLEPREAGRLFVADPRRLKPLEAALRAERPTRIRAPGEAASYGNVDAALAGAMLQTVRGKPFADLMEATLTGPMGLGRTSFREAYPTRDDLPAPLSAALAQQQAVGFQASGRGVQPVGPAFAESFAPAVGAWSTADDMARLIRTLLGFGWIDGAQIWGPGAAEALRTPLVSRSGVNGWPGGLMQTALPGGFPSFGHSGAAPGFRAALTVAPDLRLGVFVAANSEAAQPLVDGLAAGVAERFYAPPPAPMPPADPDLARRRAVYEGDYLSSRRSHHGLEKFVDHLRRIVQVRVVDGRLSLGEGGHGGTYAVDPAQPGRFRALTSPETVVFSLRGGHAETFTPSSNMETFQRIGLIFSPRLLLGVALGVVALSLAVLAAGVGRLGRDQRQSGAQALAGAVLALTAAGWLGAVGAFLLWRREMTDVVSLMLRWPGTWLVTGSTLALAASILAVLSLLLLPQVWRSDRRGAGWTSGRKLGHTLSTLAFVLFAGLLAVWGALAPWSA